MFGNNGKESKNSTLSSGLSGLQSSNSLVQGTQIEGSIFTDTDLRVDGKIIGTIDSKGKVIIGPTGYVEGDIQCVNAVIEGNFDGSLIVSEILHVKETAVIQGEVTTAKLIVQSGSVFNVTCKMGGQRIKEIKKQDEKHELELGKLTKVVNQ